MFQKVCFIGLGLIGASLAQAMRDQHLARQIVAVSRSQSTIDKGIGYGLLDAGFATAIDGVQGADLIVIATPVQAVRGIFEQIKDHITPNTIITDVGSTKGNIIADAIAVLGDGFYDQLPSGFVPAHPIAGAEKSGIDARNPRLFVNHKIILTPLPTTSVEAAKQVTALWQRTGAEVVIMTADHHDAVLARTSHLPHLLAYTLVAQLANHNDNMDIFRFAAGGFRDFTRIAASDPTMWHDIFYANKTALLSAIDDFSEHLAGLRQIIVDDNSQEMLSILTQARHARQHFGYMLNQTAYLEKNTMQPNTLKQSYLIQPSEQFTGTHTVPGDKSISHRSIMFGSLAEGITHVTGFLEGEDALSTLQAFVDMGVKIERDGDNVTIYGVGMNGLSTPKQPLDMGNSGTSMRLLAGILSAQQFDSVMIGDASLSKRPMERVAKPLREMGAKVQTTGEKGTPPLSITRRGITGNQTLQGITYDMPMASAQVKSCLLLAGLWADGTTTVIEPEITRDHTERMLTAFGYPVQSVALPNGGNQISVTGGGKLTACDIAVPADISSAAFFMVAAAIAKHGNVTLTQVGINPTRTGVIDILKLMGADIRLQNESVVGGEPVADIVVRSSQLKGIEIPEQLVPLAIDEFPVLFVAASCATGKTVLHGAAELRVKESDRIQVMADGLQTLGIDCTVLEDGIEIIGKGDMDNVFGGGEIECHHDHRIAMSFTVASLRASDAITIHGTETVNTSFPNFAELVNQAGLKVKVVSE